MKRRTQQSGMVAIFVVIFSTILVAIITVSFLRSMIQEEKQASNNNLSQSAYDSAVTGVEDGKRVIRAALQATGTAQQKAKNAIDNKSCSTIADAGIVAMGSETQIKSNGGVSLQNQAYTCVKITMNTNDVILNLTEGESVVVPLKAMSSFNTIDIQWMHRNNSDGGTAYIGGEATDLAAPTSGNYDKLPAKADWNIAAASLLRVQSILPTESSVSLNDLDSSVVTTNFLRPAAAISTAPPFNINLASMRATSTNTVTSLNAIACSTTKYKNGNYACNARLSKPDSAMVPSGSNVAYLRLTSLYRDTSVKITLAKDNSGSSTSIVQFDGVQPEIDSTGRADDVFRRIRSRVNVGFNGFTFPEYAVDISGNLCKNFYVTPDVADTIGESCTP